MVYCSAFVAQRGGDLHPFLPPVKEGVGDKKDSFLAIVDGGSSFCRRSCTGVASEKADKTPMVNGTVRAIEQVGTNIWLGGKFTQVKQHNGTVDNSEKT